MRKIILLMLLCLLLPCAAQAETTIVVASDMHIIAPELTDMGAYFTKTYENGDGKVMRYADEVMRSFLDEVIAMRPDALILSGDITFEGAQLSHEYVARLLMGVQNAGIPVYVLPGNHDIESPVAAKYVGDGYELTDSVTSDEFYAIYYAYGFAHAIAKDTASLSYAAQIAPGLRLLMIDTNTAAYPGGFGETTRAFIARQLKDAQDAGDKVITVTHQSLLSHNDLFNAGLFGAGFMVSGAEELQAMLETADTVVNLSGHMHIQHIEQSESGLIDIATSSLVVSPCQYGVLTLEDGTAQYRTQTVNVAKWAQKKGLDDPNLLDFETYAADFFTKTASSASLPADLSDQQWLMDTYHALHSAYFAGRLDTIDLDRERFSPWLQKAGLFTYMYLQSILDEPFVDQTKLTFSY